jgi:putative acetyltransferase
MSLLTVREERPADIEAIRAVNLQAFGQSGEGLLVDALRSNDGVLLSLVATRNGDVLGHILFSPVTVRSGREQITGAGLGPMSVLPGHQRQGIGGKLVEAGKQKLHGLGLPFIVVLGHPEYYPRFGFEPASRYAIRCEWDVPDNVFMILVMDPPTMIGISGLAEYRPEFSSTL